jgi:hypothetical protein
MLAPRAASAMAWSADMNLALAWHPRGVVLIA